MGILRGLSSLRSDKRGVSALEFAFAAPVMILLMLVGIDTARFVIATRRVETVAATIGQMISVNTSGTVNTTDLQFYHDSAMVIFPQVLADSKQRGIAWGADIGITMSSVLFSQVGSVYVPKVIWTGGSSPRSCTVPLVAAADTATASATTLPQDTFGTGSVIVVDLTFSFRPTIAPQFMRTIPITRSYYIAPRYVSLVSYTVAQTNNFAKLC